MRTSGQPTADIANILYSTHYLQNIFIRHPELMEYFDSLTGQVKKIFLLFISYKTHVSFTNTFKHWTFPCFLTQESCSLASQGQQRVLLLI